MQSLWRDQDAGATDTDQLVYLSNLIGRDPLLVQPGGGNTSVKLDEPDIFGCDTAALVVKGSGTDLRTITSNGFTHLYVDRLALLKARVAVSDEEMVRLMRAAMLFPDRDPVPSVETPLHSLLPYRFIAHTHDVATLSLSDTPHAEEHVARVFASEVAFLPYARPGFPLAKRLAERYAEAPPPDAIALVLEKHGLAVWGEAAKACYQNLCRVITKAEEFVATRGAGKRVFGPPAGSVLDDARRRALAATLMPAIRGELASHGWQPTLCFDDSPDVLDAVSDDSFAEIAARGMMTPEHILRCGVRPLLLRLDLNGPVEELKQAARDAIRSLRGSYLSYATANGQTTPIPDYLKVVTVPGLGLICAGKDRRLALIAVECYAATLKAIAGAEAVESFEFLSDADACAMEYWPLERRKVEESAKSRAELEGRIAFVIGAASGIGRATALALAQAGATVLVVDIDGAGGAETVRMIEAGSGRAALAEADVSTTAGFHRAARGDSIRSGRGGQRLGNALHR